MRITNWKYKGNRNIIISNDNIAVSYTHLKQLAREGMTMVVVTHEMGFAKEVGSRVIFIDSGQIKEQAKPDEFFDHPKDPRLQEFLSKIL